MVLLAFLITSTKMLSQDNVNAKIVTKTLDNLIDIKGVAQNLDVTYKEDLTYLLFSLKKGVQGNFSRNSQSGEFSLEPNEERELATLKINIQEGEQCTVYLFLRKDDDLISKDSIVIYSAESIQEKQYIAESEIEITGLVVEDVKTKLGKDFYDYFYQKYVTSGSQYSFIINIDEIPGIGRSSKISISADDRILFEFMTRPDDEFIQAAAEEALRYISGYAAQRKLLYKNKKI
jgi:hypothetical protein